MESVGVGEITYECRAKAGMAGSFEWVFVGPNATFTNDPAPRSRVRPARSGAAPAGR